MGKTARKTISIITALVLAFVLCSCGAEQAPAERPTTSNSAAPVTIGNENDETVQCIDAVEAFGYVEVSHSRRFILNRDYPYDHASGLMVWYPSDWEYYEFSNGVSHQGIGFGVNDIIKDDETFESLDELAYGVWEIESPAYEGHLRYSVPVGTTGNGLMLIWDASDTANNRIFQAADNNWKVHVLFEDNEYFYVVTWTARGLTEQDLLDSIPTLISLLKYIEPGGGRAFL